MSQTEPQTNSTDYKGGQIKSLYLHNFMCHELFDIKFSPGVNFIYGPNGSGKSTILASICICLGSNAAFTNRGTLVKLIKEGAPNFTIVVELNNNCSDAHPDYSGDSIFIKRTYSRSGTGSLSISDCSSSDREDFSLKDIAFRKSTKSEINNLLDHFNIQHSNPCIILTQDGAREFLNSKSPKERYSIFNKATLMDRMESEIMEATDNVFELRKELAKKEDEIEINRETVRMKKNEFLKCKKIRDRDKNLKILDIKMNYSKSYSKNSEIEKKMKSKNKFESEIDKRREEMMNEDQKIADLKEEREKKLEAIERLKNEIENKENDHLQYNTQKKDKAKDLAHKKQEIIKSQQKVRELKTMFTAHSAKLEKFGLTTGEESDLYSKYEDIMKDLNTKKEEKTKMLESLKSEYEDKEEPVKELNNNLSSCDSRVMNSRRELERISLMEKKLKESSSSRANLFGEFASEIQREIERNQQQFSQKPIGPLGSFIRLKDDKFADQVAACISIYNLSSYLVSTAKDADLLSSIFNKFRHKKTPSIIVQRFNPSLYQIPERASFVQNFRVIDAVEFNPSNKLSGNETNWFINCFVDSFRIELSYIAKNYDEGNQILMLFRKNQKHKSPNVYLEDGSKMFDNNYKSISKMANYGNLQSSLLKQNSANDTNKLQTQKRYHEKEITVFTNEKAGIEKKLAAIREETTQIRNRMKAVNEEKNKIEKEKKENEEKYDAILRKMKESSDHDQIDKAKNELEKVRSELGLASAHLDSLTSENDQIEEAIEEIGRKIRSNTATIESKKNSMEDELTASKEMKANLRKLEKSDNQKAKEELSEKIQKVTRELVLLKEDFETFKKAIEEDCESLGISPEEYSDYSPEIALNIEKVSDLEAEKKFLQESSKNVQDISEEELKRVENEWKKLNDALASALEREKNITDTIGKLEDIIEDRNDKKENFKYDTGEKISEMFQSLLRKQGHDGSIEINHDRKELKLHVELVNSKNTDSKNSTANFSGGERSFTTLAFIIAIGEFLETPFRAIDEFDVFMDAVNRNISIKMLISACNRNKDRQYLFITPQDISLLEEFEGVKVLKLNAKQ